MRAGGHARPCSIPMPRVVLVPGSACSASGARPRMRRIAADLAENMRSRTMSDAEGDRPLRARSRGRPVRLRILVARTGQAARRRETLPLTGQVAVVTGGAGAIGAATARPFAAAGAAVALLDLDRRSGASQAAADRQRRHRPRMRRDRCRVGGATRSTAVSATFGGVDIVVSNAGAAWQGADRRGRRGDPAQELRAEFLRPSDRRAGRPCGSCWSRAPAAACCSTSRKQAVNPGAEFRPYGLPKAATLFLLRQYALEHGADGIRANAVNADRIRSGLLDRRDDQGRAQARGVSEKDYMSGNLLGREVTAEDVAQAFLPRPWRSRPPATSPPSTAATSPRRCASVVLIPVLGARR